MARHRSSLPHYLALQSEGYQRRGQVDEGLSVVVAGALSVINSTGERYYEAELYRLRGELLRQKATTQAEAEECFVRPSPWPAASRQSR